MTCEICELLKKKKQILKETDQFVVFRVETEKDVIAATKEHKIELDDHKKNYMVSCLLYAIGMDLKQKWSVSQPKSEHLHIMAKNKGEVLSKKQ